MTNPERIENDHDGHQDEFLADEVRVRASENQALKYKFRNKIKYRKPSTVRRKLKKRYHKYKTGVIIALLIFSGILFFGLMINTAYQQSKELEKKNLEIKIQKKIQEAEKNKLF